MSKLFNLKEWLTVADAARHLTIVFDEEVSEADVLRLALDGRLRLSVYLVNRGSAKRAKIVSTTRVPLLGEQLDEDQREALLLALDEMMQVVAGEAYDSLRFKQNVKMGDGEFLRFEPTVVEIEGVLDLPMIGAEKLDIEHEFQKLTSGPDVTLHCLDGAFVERDGQLYQLQSHFADYELFKKENLKKPWYHPQNYYPSPTLPDDAVLVVRTKALREFERSLDNGEVARVSQGSVSGKLAKLNQAATKFWSRADRDDRGTYPDTELVISWLVDQGFSKTLADKAATIIRPEWAPTGRKPDE